jgi:hypothetical protein
VRRRLPEAERSTFTTCLYNIDDETFWDALEEAGLIGMPRYFGGPLDPVQRVRLPDGSAPWRTVYEELTWPTTSVSNSADDEARRVVDTATHNDAASVDNASHRGVPSSDAARANVNNALATRRNDDDDEHEALVDQWCAYLAAPTYASRVAAIEQPSPVVAAPSHAAEPEAELSSDAHSEPEVNDDDDNDDDNYAVIRTSSRQTRQSSTVRSSRSSTRKK